MSTSKKTEVVATAKAGIAMGDNNYMSRRYRVHLKVWGLGATMLVVIVCVGWLVDLHYAAQRAASGSNKKQSVLNATTVYKHQSVSDQALGLSLGGQSVAAQQLLDVQINNTSDPAQKAVLYEQKSNLANTTGDYSQGLAYAQKAESLNPTAGSAEWIAMNAESIGNKTMALKYYRLELQRLKPPIGPGTQSALEAKIKSLGG